MWRFRLFWFSKQYLNSMTKKCTVNVSISKHSLMFSMHVSLITTFLLSTHLCVHYVKPVPAAWSMRLSFIWGIKHQICQPLALRLPVDIFHVYFEVVVPGELLMAELAFCHRPVWVVCQLVPAEHLLQAEWQVTHLKTTEHTHRVIFFITLSFNLWSCLQNSSAVCRL